MEMVEHAVVRELEWEMMYGNGKEWESTGHFVIIVVKYVAIMFF